MAQPKHIEHPDDWNMHEGEFAKACSQLGYRLITLSDATRERALTKIEAQSLQRIGDAVRAIGG
jgi:hypothetical protein